MKIAKQAKHSFPDQQKVQRIHSPKERLTVTLALLLRARTPDPGLKSVSQCLLLFEDECRTGACVIQSQDEEHENVVI